MILCVPILFLRKEEWWVLTTRLSRAFAKKIKFTELQPYQFVQVFVISYLVTSPMTFLAGGLQVAKRAERRGRLIHSFTLLHHSLIHPILCSPEHFVCGCSRARSSIVCQAHFLNNQSFRPWKSSGENSHMTFRCRQSLQSPKNSQLTLEHDNQKISILFTFSGARGLDCRGHNFVPGARFGTNSLGTTAERSRGHSSSISDPTQLTMLIPSFPSCCCCRCRISQAIDCSGFAMDHQPIRATLKCPIPIQVNGVRTNRPFDDI
jgi:hypothetical protein